MTWRACKGNWHDEPVPANECDFSHLLAGLRGTDAPTGQWGIVMACIIRYAGLKRVVELGVWKGGTTVCLAAACRDTGGTCIAVDKDDCREARERLKSLGLESPHCVFVQGLTWDVPYDGVDIDLLFIDAGHAKAEVEADWRRWSPLVRPGGLIFIDNAQSEIGVREFLPSIPWPKIVLPESFGMAIIQKPR